VVEHFRALGEGGAGAADRSDTIRFVTADLAPRLFEYLGGIVRGSKACLLEIDGHHLHLLIRESKSAGDPANAGPRPLYLATQG